MTDLKKPKNKIQELSSSYPEAQAIDVLNKIQELERENIELKDILKEYGIVYKDNKLSDMEYISLKQLENFKKISLERHLDKDEVCMIDILHKNLLMARNIPISKKVNKEKKTAEELLEIVKS